MPVDRQLQAVSIKKSSDNFFTARANWMDGLISELTVSMSQEFLGIQKPVSIAVNHQDDFSFF